MSPRLAPRFSSSQNARLGPLPRVRALPADPGYSKRRILTAGPKRVLARPGVRVEGMMVDALSEIEIDRPRVEVAGYASDPDNAILWYANIKAVEWESPKPLALGSRVAFVADFLGRRLVYTYEVTALVPGERLVMSTAQGPFPMETTYTWVDIDRKSVV